MVYSTKTTAIIEHIIYDEMDDHYGAEPEYPWNDWNKYVTITLKMAKMFFLTALFDSRQVKIFLRAYKDGIMGRSGKRMEP